MIKIMFALLFVINAGYSACTKINMPTDFSAVANGTRANLKANFDEVQTRSNPCMDSVDEVRGRFSGYTGSLLMSSLEHLRLRLDSDASATGRFLVEGGSGDSLFRVSEDSSAKVFGALSVAGTSIFTGAPTFSSLTASLPVFTNGSKALVSNAMTGTGSVVMSASPTLTGTIAATDATLAGNLTLSSIATGRVPYTTTAGLLTSGTGLTYNGTAFSVTGTGAISGNTTITGNATVGPTGTGNPSAETADITITAGSSGNVVSSLTMRGFRTSNAAFATNYAYHGSTIVGRTQWLRDGADDAGAWKLFTMPTGGAITERLVVSSSGDLGFNVNKFTIAGASGNTAVAGTLGVTGVTTATGGLTLGASFVDKTTSLTSNTTLTSAHSTIFASASGGSFTITLPAAAGNTGLTYTIYKTDVSAAATGGGNTVTIDGNASETIGGSTTQVLASNTGVGRIKIICDGSNWQIQELYDEGTFTLTLTGCTTSPTTTASYSRIGKLVTTRHGLITGTSNAATATLTGLPSSIQGLGDACNIYTTLDNGLTYPGYALVTTVISLGYYSTLTTPTQTFTASGTKGTSTTVITYRI